MPRIMFHVNRIKYNGPLHFISLNTSPPPFPPTPHLLRNHGILEGISSGVEYNIKEFFGVGALIFTNFFRGRTLIVLR